MAWKRCDCGSNTAPDRRLRWINSSVTTPPTPGIWSPWRLASTNNSPYGMGRPHQPTLDSMDGRHDRWEWAGYGQTDRGLIRANNQDAFLVDNRRRLWAVADGMGGHPGGGCGQPIGRRHPRRF